MNVVIDGNAFLNVSTSIVKNLLEKDKRLGEKYYVSDLLDDSKFLLKDQAASTFRKFVLNYFSSIVSPFRGGVGAVFFVFDAKSWRKEYIKNFFNQEKTEPTFEYKGGRKYDDKIYLFFDFFQNEVIPVLNSMGVVSVRVVGAEGDDLIAHIIENTTGDTCIWSVDQDLIQLLENQNRNVILVTPKMMTKHKRVFVNSLPMQQKGIDLFEFGAETVNNSSIDEVIKEFIIRDFVKYEVDPVEELITKILGGDKSDAIPRVHPKLTKAKVDSILSKLKEISDFEWHTIISLIRNSNEAFFSNLLELIKLELKNISPEDLAVLRKTLLFNVKIICLSTQHLPEHILKSIQEKVDLNQVKKFDIISFKKYHSLKQ